MRTLMIFALVMLDRGGNRTGQEFYFQELSSCIEVKDALIYQSTHIHAYVRARTRHFSAFCEVREIDQKDAGTKYLFRDDQVRVKVQD